MRKITALTIGALMTLSIGGCGKNHNASPVTQNTETTENTKVEMPNPFVDVTLEEAIELAGFDFKIPDTIEGYDSRSIMVIENQLIQAIYGNEDEKAGLSDEELNKIDWEKVNFDPDKIVLRKAKGNDDVSGDYNEYSEITAITIDGKEVTMKGNNGTVYVAIWTENEYSFSVAANNGVTSDSMTSIISGIQ